MRDPRKDPRPLDSIRFKRAKGGYIICNVKRVIGRSISFFENTGYLVKLRYMTLSGWRKYSADAEVLEVSHAD